MKIDDNIVKLVKAGGVGVMPTDTIFGVVASVKYEASIKKIYQVKQRDYNKKLIHLIGDVQQLPDLGVRLSDVQLKGLKKVWPGPVSVEFACDDTIPYLHKNTYKIAVRLPDAGWLSDFVNKTGPIVATSANVSGLPTPQNLEEIKVQLPGLDFYVDGPVGAVPSRLARMSQSGEISWLDRA